MDRQLLRPAIVSLLAAMAARASAQEAPVAAQAAAVRSEAAAPSVRCEGDTCSSDEGLLFRLRTRSYDEPRTRDTNTRSSSEALQPDRRATIDMEQPGKAVATGRFSISVPGGGVIWATEDPTLGQPVLSVSAPAFASFDGQRIVAPLQFYVRSNYPAFIERYEVSIYRAADGDLIEPLAQFPLPVAGVSATQWPGALPDKYRYRTGDQLVYVLRAYGANGSFDETWPRTLQLVTPQEAEHGAQRLREAGERVLGTALTAEQAQEQSLIDSVFAEDRLRQRNIRVRGSRIRIQGRNLPASRALTIDGTRYPVDRERKFVAEFLAPVGKHVFDIGLEGGDADPVHQTLAVDVTGRYFFGTGIADVTISQNDISGSREPFAADPRADDDILYDGRLAFYIKAKLNQYLITAQADTTERDLEHLFDGFGEAEPRDIFRRLDPDLYYPVYGDDSVTYRDVDTQGKFYARVDWDRNQAIWGNYSTGLTGTEYAQYVRSLYGAALDWNSQRTNAWGDAGTQLRAFGSQAETAPGHNEFVGTGGSLYYLKHGDVLPGSDVVVLEVRDRSTGRVENRVSLRRGADYEIDEIQGRILLTRPLGQVTRENIPTLTRDAPLSGLEQRLLVDYEWVPSGFDDDEITAGVRGKHWFGDHVALGATYVDENRAGEDYTLLGGDVTLQAGKGTYLKYEYSQSEQLSQPTFLSINGGMSFLQTNAAGQIDGEAMAAEARANFRELGWSSQDWSAGLWWHHVDAGYSVSRYDVNVEVEEYGAEVLGYFTEHFSLYSRVTRLERDPLSLDQAQLTAEWRITDLDTVAAEIRSVEEQSFDSAGTGMLGAVKYMRRFGTSLDVYGVGQLTVDDDGGAYRNNDAATLGARYLLGDVSSVGAEVTSGDRGDAVQINSELQLNPQQTVYGSYTYSTDTTEYDSLFSPNRQNGSTLGQRWRLSNQVTQFNESQYLKAPNGTGLSHIFGMDFFPARAWNFGFAVQDGELINFVGDRVDRTAISLHGGRTTPGTDWQSKLEWRRDRQGEQREQWVSTNRLMYKINESWRAALRLNYSDTEEAGGGVGDAKFVEGNVGFAWRPWNSTRWAGFGRYTYLYDVSSLTQENAQALYDQRTQIFSLEGVYKPGPRWEYAAKAAWREARVRFGRNRGAWFDVDTLFAGLELRYDLFQRWHALAAYRWLDVTDGGSRSGALVGLDRDLGGNFRIGVGYNFASFSDDLTDFDYDHQGWFINLLGRY